MEVQQKSFFESHLATSKFVQMVIELPLVKAAVGTAGDAYVKVKDSNALVGKSIELAINISNAVALKINPIAEKGILVCAPITTKMDDIAASSLDRLITKVPVIKEEPKEIVQNTRSAIEKRVTAINDLTQTALRSWPAQSVMNMYEAVLITACSTLDTVLPPRKDENSSEQNGLTSKTDYPPEEDKHKRGIWLAQKTYLAVSTAFQRLFGICQSQVHNAANATDAVYKQVKNAVGDGSNANTTESNNTTATNGDSSKPQTKKQKNKPKNQQD